jgi:mono/diheme cytochrome c family protein
MSYDLRLQRRVDWLVWAAALAFGAFAMHEVQGATPAATSPPPASTRVPQVVATAPAAIAPAPEAIYRRECGDCHLAYASRLLPAGTWRQVMTGLDRHFGVDASLDPATAAVISNWLVQGAASPRRSSREGSEREDGDEAEEGEKIRGDRVVPGGARPDDSASLRITTTPWFVREHREVPAATWRRAAIGSAANCAACHTDAEKGRFSERALRIPN